MLIMVFMDGHRWTVMDGKKNMSFCSFDALRPTSLFSNKRILTQSPYEQRRTLMQFSLIS